MNNLNFENVNKRISKRKITRVHNNIKMLKFQSDLYQNELENESCTTSSKLNEGFSNQNYKLNLNEYAKLLKASLYECEECNITCFNKIQHLLNNHIEQNIKCEECNKNIPLNNYVVHFKSCQNTLKYFCKICNAGFCDSQSINNHTNSCENCSNNVDLDSSMFINTIEFGVETVEPSTSLVSRVDKTAINKNDRSISNNANALQNEKKESNRNQCKSDKSNAKTKSKANELESLESISTMIYPECDNDDLSEGDSNMFALEVLDILEIYNNRNVQEISLMHNDIQIPIYEGQEDVVASNSRARYDCHMCLDFSTENFEEFYAHLLEHDKSISKKKEAQIRSNCMICGSVVPGNDLLTHLRIHRNHIQCNICKDYVLQNEFQSHITEHKKHFSCRICGEIYKSSAAIRQHMNCHRKGVSYSCGKCNLVFSSLQKLISHISFVHKSIVKDYSECIYCLELTEVIKNHTYTASACKLKCKTCLKCLKTNQEYARHIRSCEVNHCSQRTISCSPNKKMLHVYKCKICGKKSRSYERLREHVEAHKIDSLYEKHLVRQQRVTCTICQYEIPKQYLQVHNERHASNDKCEICSQFVGKDEIIGHLECHRSALKCILCEEEFPTKKDLENHRFSHNKLVQRQCNFCQLNFVNEISRIKHMNLVHMRVDPEFVECNYCKELISDQIENHILIPRYCQFRCKLCNRKFTNLEDYKYHVDAEHRDILAHK